MATKDASSEDAGTRRAPAVWRARCPTVAVEELTAAGHPPRLAAALACRVSDASEAERFLRPALEHLNDPFRLAGMAAAVARLEGARESGERVVIVGDYDVDGVASTALLLAVLRACGLEAEAVLPHRMRDGYGFQPRQVERARELGASLIVTVDCGTTSGATVRAALGQGIDVIVTDHHLPDADFPAEAIQINPRQGICDYPFDDLCAAGLALKLAQALCQRLGRPIDLAPLLRMACLGTIADVVPLVGENRVIAQLGLRALERTRSVGLQALYHEAGIRPPLRAEDVGFRIGPRLNAAGRLDSPEGALELLLSREPDRARHLASQLEGWNQQRREAERRVVDEGRAAFAERDPLPGILVAASPEWHRGVVGIAAGRLARHFHRPTLLLAIENGRAVGSGRSIPGLSLHGFLDRWRDRFERFGGHAQAVGLSVASDRLLALQQEWEEAAQWPAKTLTRSLEYELALDGAEVNRDLVAELRSLEPHGEGNPQPLVRIGPLELVGEPRSFGNGHLKARARARDGSSLWLLGWHWQERSGELRRPFEVLAHVEWDGYLASPVLRLADCRPAGAGEGTQAPLTEAADSGWG